MGKRGIGLQEGCICCNSHFLGKPLRMVCWEVGSLYSSLEKITSIGTLNAGLSLLSTKFDNYPWVFLKINP